MTSGGKLIEGIFKGETINTPSMLCVEDYLDALNWAKRLGGLDALVARADANFAVHRRVRRKVRLARQPGRRCGDALQHLGLPVDRRPEVTALDDKDQAAFAKGMVSRSKRKASPTTSAPTATRRPACASGPARPSRRPIWWR
jgi:phosphoserine aminotransferase